MRIRTDEIPDPPKGDSGGQSCDGGNCNAESVGWRYYPDRKEWLPVCHGHFFVKGVPAVFRKADQP
jgi:hypothetical protein